MSKTHTGWHWLNEDQKLRDGRDAPPDGEWLVHDGELEMCSRGLHWSRRIIDSLQYAPGPVLCRVEARGETLHDDNKSVSAERRILWRVHLPDDVLRAFARRCALDVIHLWDAPDVVRRYLETGDESLRDAARDAAWAAAGAAAGVATRAAARAAAWAATRAAAGVATRAAARAAAWAATRAAAGAAARAAARAATLTRFNQRLTSMVIAEAKRQGVYR